MNKEYWLIMKGKTKIELLDKVIAKNLKDAEFQFKSRKGNFEFEGYKYIIAESKRWLN